MAAAPGGLKLHAELTFLYGSSALAALAAAARMYRAAWQPAFSLLLGLVAGVAALLGLCPAAALLGDLALLLAWPLELLYAAAARVYSLQLYYVGGWRRRGGVGCGRCSCCRATLRRCRAAAAPPPLRRSRHRAPVLAAG
jgi:hypothetical protein